MAPAQKPKTSGGKGAGKGKKPASTGKKVDEEREETLQAVVWFRSLENTRRAVLTNCLQILADSFETRFSPFTLETPRVSLRLIVLCCIVLRGVAYVHQCVREGLGPG